MALVRTKVSEERIASIIRVDIICELGMLTVITETSNSVSVRHLMETI
jgi:hypothetical protein